MIRKLMALPCLLAFAVACGQGRTDDQNAGAGTGSETGALPADTGYTGGIEDTTAAPSADVPDTTAPAGDSAAVGSEKNQNQSGVTNTETGQSELGDDATKATPDQGEPVTSKGDTVGTSGTGATSDTTQ